MSTRRQAREESQAGVVGGLGRDWSTIGFGQAYGLESGFNAVVSGGRGILGRDWSTMVRDGHMAWSLVFMLLVRFG